VSLLIGRDPVALYPAGGADSHGWVLPGARPVWEGIGNLQAGPGRSDPRAADGGGHGPQDPAAIPSAVLYLPPEAPLVDGMTAEIAGRRYAVSQARIVNDPRPTGELDCWAATATAAGTG
jgi:hypothetical protein